MRALRRCLAILGLAMLAVGTGAQAVQAHAELVRSDPAAGAVLTDHPSTVRLWFSEEISPALSSATLVDGSGGLVPGARTAVDPSDQRSLVLELPSLSTGSYGVLWQVLAEGDGHTTSGVLVFSLGAPSASPPTVAGGLPAGSGTTDASASPIEVALRWLAFCLLAGAIGGLAFAGLVLGRARTGGDPRLGSAVRSARERVLRFALVCAGAAAIVSVAILFEQAEEVASPLGGRWWTTGVAQVLTLSRWGLLWIAREAALVALAGVLFAMVSAARRNDRMLGWRPFAMAGVLVLAVVWIQALGSHAAALESGRTVAVAADAVHLLTACLWLGSLPALVLILWSSGSDGASRADLLRACARPFSLLAITSVCLVVVTGLYSAGREVETVDGIASTSYGHALLAKSALLALTAALGAVNAARLHGWSPRWLGPTRALVAGRSPSRRLIAIEAGVGAILLLAAGVLTSTPPARGPVVAPTPDASWTGHGSVADLVVSVSVSPNRPGVNGFTVHADSSRRPPPATIAGVVLELRRGDGSMRVQLEQVELGRYFGTGTLDTSGRWRLTTLIDRADDRLSVPLAWWVSEPAPVRLIEPQGRRLAPLVNGLALGLFAAAVLVALLLVVKRRRGWGAGPTGPSIDAPADAAEDAEVRILEVVP